MRQVQLLMKEATLIIIVIKGDFMQIKLGKIGEVITGLEELNQEIFLILSTP